MATAERDDVTRQGNAKGPRDAGAFRRTCPPEILLVILHPEGCAYPPISIPYFAGSFAMRAAAMSFGT